jgi:hypothetical protein
MNRKRIAILAALAVLAIVARVLPGPRTIDDAFITFRYARNLLAGEGFVYNPGERVMGTTTPLYTLTMAGLGLVSGGTQADFPLLALMLNSLADAATCILLWQIGKKLGSELAGFAVGLIWAIAPYSVTFAIGGMETSLYVLLLTLVVYFYLHKKIEAAAFYAALALLTRIDAAILLAPIGLDYLIRLLRKRESLAWKALPAFLIPLVAWYGFAGIYFGNILPHSVTAKLVAYRLEPGASLVRLLQHYATPFLEQNSLGGIGIAVGLVLYPFLFFIGARRAWKADTRSLAVVVYPWLYFLAFALPNPLIFRWYLTPPLPVYYLGIFLGLEQLFHAIFGLGRPQVASWRRIAAGVLLITLPLISSLSEWRLHPDNGPDRPAPDMAYIQLELFYRQAAAAVASHVKADTVLAAGDVGVLGFYSGARILDTVGLNSPESVQYYPLDAAMYEINYAVAPNLILDKKPDLIIILEVYGRKGLLKDDRFLSQYYLLETIDTDMYGSRGMLIYERIE